MARTKKPRLGRGLSSLMASPVSVTPPADPAQTPPQAPLSGAAAAPPVPEPADGDGRALYYLPVERIVPNPDQPRQSFDPATLEQLAASIRQAGLMQPIVVRPDPGNPNQYELVAGERRWRAAQLAGLDTLPAVVRELDDQQVAEWALIENLQREDLNPIDRAQAFRRLVNQFNLSHEQVADRVGVERPTITNTLRLLDLHDDIQQAVRGGQLSAGHARAIGGLADREVQAVMGRRVIEAGWSVRKTEEEVRRAAAGEPRSTDNGSGGGRAPARRSPHVIDLEQQVANQLQTKVHIKPGRKKGTGTLTLEYYSLDQFDALLSRMGVDVD